MFRKIVFFTIVLLLSLFLLVASGEQKGGDEFPPYMRHAGSAPGGVWWPFAAQMCVVVERETGVISTLQPGAAYENIKAVHFGDSETGFTHSSTGYMAFNGLGIFEKEGIKYDNIRHMLNVNPQGAHFIVRADSDITSFKDLEKKRFGFGRVGSGANVIAMAVFELYGLTLESFRSVSYLGYTEGPQMLADKNIDAFVALGPHPYSPLAEIDFNPGFRLLKIDEEMLDKFFETDTTGHTRVTIEKGTYNNMDEDVVTIGNYLGVMVNKDLSEKFVYEMTKAIFENLELMWESGPLARDWLRLETALAGNLIPVHPGALKYYKEQGITK